MEPPAPSASTGQHGLMAAVWLALVAMFTGLLAHSEARQPPEDVPESALAPLPLRIDEGSRARSRESISAVFFEADSAALTEAGTRWLHRFAEQTAHLRPGVLLRLDILPPGDRADVTAARIAAVAATLDAAGADLERIEIGTHRPDEGAHFGLAVSRQGGDQ